MNIAAMDIYSVPGWYWDMIDPFSAAIHKVDIFRLWTGDWALRSHLHHILG
jgi:hypothetical protein